MKASVYQEGRSFITHRGKSPLGPGSNHEEAISGIHLHQPPNRIATGPKGP